MVYGTESKRGGGVGTLSWLRRVSDGTCQPFFIVVAVAASETAALGGNLLLVEMIFLFFNDGAMDPW